MSAGEKVPSPTRPKEDTMTTTITDAIQGMYGPSRWLDETIIPMLMPYTKDAWINSEYIEFADLEGDAAAQLARLLTPPARQDRQNNAPTILTLLRIAATTPGVTLSGYIIRAPRRDERVSVDAISAPEHLFAPDPAGNDDEALLPIEWSTFSQVLGISDEVIPPNDFRSYRNVDGEVMWRAWWD